MAVTFTAQPSSGGVNIENLLTELTTIGNRGNYNVPMKLPKPKPQTALGAFAGLPPGTGATGGVTGGTMNVPGDLGRLMRMIRGQESGSPQGNYGAVNNDSGALGAYQILWSNLSSNNGYDWDRQALGRDVSREEFLRNPGIQDAIARYKLGKLLASRGMAGAAATWYGGEWGYNHMYDKRPQGGYPSMYDYVMSVMSKY